MRNIRRVAAFLGYFFIDTLFPPIAEEKYVRRVRYSALREAAAPLTNYACGVPLLALMPYRVEIVQTVIQEAKFSGNMRAQMQLGKILAMHIMHIVKIMTSSNKSEESIKENTRNPQTVVLVPLPLGKKRLKERGYNQVQKIVECSLPYFADSDYRVLMKPGLLVRTRETTPQTTLGRSDRLTNMQNAFAATCPLNDTYLYIVVDDVLTTGATLFAAHEALRAARATQLLAIALAH